MTIDIARASSVTTGEIAVSADCEINLRHLTLLRHKTMKLTGRRTVFLHEERFQVASQVRYEVFFFVAFQVCCNLVFITHIFSAFFVKDRGSEFLIHPLYPVVKETSLRLQVHDQFRPSKACSSSMLSRIDKNVEGRALATL
jgi:hypothetical protein